MLEQLSKRRDIRTFSVSPENFTGGKGEGGRAEKGTGSYPSRELGVGWKVSPSVDIESGETFTMADIAGSGAIKHIWVTDASPSGRKLILRIYWDGSDKPSQ